MAHYAVHTPIQGKEDLIAKYKAKEPTNQNNPAYAAMIQSLDDAVGKIISAIDELGIAEKTIVFFTSDNGGLLGITSNSPLRSGKGSCYEGGIRVPLMIRWPGVTDQGGISSQPVSSCDLYPTVLSILGIENPSKRVLDGIDLSKILKDPSAVLSKRNLYFHYPHYYSTTSPVSAIRSGDWKLLEYYEDGHIELYNLADDLGEVVNLSDRRPDIVEQLTSALKRWRDEVDAQIPEPNPNFEQGH